MISLDTLTQMYAVIAEGACPKVLARRFDMDLLRAQELCRVVREAVGPKKIDKLRFKAMWEAGESRNAIADELGCAVKSVTQIRIRMGLKPRERGGARVGGGLPRRLPYARMKDLNDQGLKAREIAGRVGCSPSSVVRMRREIRANG